MGGFSDDEKAVAIVQQCPGIELKRFAIRMGWKVRSRDDLTSAEMERGLNGLIERGVIAIREPNKVRTEATIYLPGTIPDDNAAPQREKGYRERPCRTYIDPTIAGVWQKPPSASGQEREAMRTGYERVIEVIEEMRQSGTIWTRDEVCKRAGVVDNYMAPTSQAYRADDAREAYEAAKAAIKFATDQLDQQDEQRQRFDTMMQAIDRMRQSGEELSRNQICRQAGVRHSYLDGGRDSQWSRKAREAYDEAILAIKAQQQGKAIAPDTTALQQELEELKRQNEALRARTPQIVQGGAQFLVQEAAHWRQEVTRLERELAEAQANLGACDRLLGVHGMQQGANGNGCLVKVTA